MFLIRFLAPILALVSIQKGVESGVEKTVDYFTDDEKENLIGPEAPGEKSLMPEFGFYKKSKADEWLILALGFYSIVQVAKGIETLTK